MLDVNSYFTMEVREKVALTIAVISLVQITVSFCAVSSEVPNNKSNKRSLKRNVDCETQLPLVITWQPYVQDTKTKSQQSSEKNDEIILKAFNFPDVEYPTASTPRPPYHLQKPNIVQNNAFQSNAENPSSFTASCPRCTNKISVKYKNKKYLKHKSSQSLGVTEDFPEIGVSPNPFCLMDDVAFPEVEYPLTAKEIWKPNYWKQFITSESYNELNNNGPTSISQTGGSNKMSAPKSKLWKNNNSNNLNTTPAPIPPTSTTPFVLTPYTTLYFDTTPSYVETRANVKSNSTKLAKKPTKKKKITKDAIKTTGLSSPANILNGEDNNYVNSTKTISYMTTTPLPNDNLFTNTPIEILSNLDTCLNSSSDILPYMYVMPTTPSFYLSSSDVPPASLTVNADKMPAVPYEDKNASISNAMNIIVTESRDNKDVCFEDNARNNNKSSTFDDIINISLLSSYENLNVFPTVYGEYTTEVFSDFDENMLSGVNLMTSTMSPINFVTIDEAWNNSEVIDPYNFVSYPDELEQYYIAVP